MIPKAWLLGNKCGSVLLVAKATKKPSLKATEEMPAVLPWHNLGLFCSWDGGDVGLVADPWLNR